MPVVPHVIKKGIPNTGPVAQVMVAMYADHLLLLQLQLAAPVGADPIHG